jgi:CrcB protein
MPYEDSCAGSLERDAGWMLHSPVVGALGVTRFVLVCLGGALGTGARYLLSGWALALLGSDFPYGTLAVNVVGSLLLGIIMQIGLTTNLLSPTLRLTLAAGVMGGFTTYSTFNYETLRYLQEGAWVRALLNVVAMLLLCLLAGIAGLALARRIAGA